MYGGESFKGGTPSIARLIEEGDSQKDFHRDQIRLLEWESPIWLFRDMKRVWKISKVSCQCFLQVDMTLVYSESKSRIQIL